MIRFEQVTHQFPNGVVALDAINLKIDPGEFVFVIGPSGAGKTTLLRLLLRELKPSEGKIFFQNDDLSAIKNKNIPNLRRRIGSAFQDFKLLNDRTVSENVALSLQIARKGKKEIENSVNEALELVGLTGKNLMFPAQLSGGEIQRAVIARAMVSDPDVLFADEPTGNLDPDISWQIFNLLKQIQLAGKTVIAATHCAEAVNKFKERVVCLANGRIVSDEKSGEYFPKKVNKPKKKATKEKGK